MAAKTHLFEFTVSSEASDNSISSPGFDAIIPQLKELFKEAGFDHAESTHLFGTNNDVIILMTAKSGSNTMIQTFATGHVIVNVQVPIKTGNGCAVEQVDIDSLSKRVKTLLGARKCKVFPPVERCALIDRYIPSTNNQWAEYDFDRLVFEEDTSYQNVKIVHSVQYGNVLILDNDINLAESDLAYTNAITGNGREDFNNKEVLIIGGGDGGILHELLQKSPKFVTMVEIDQVVLDAAKKHLRGICHDSLDQLEGENYKVLVQDCIPVLEGYAKQGKTFDYVINDLTAIPITKESKGSQWDFMRYILDLSMRVLKPSGKYFTQGNGILKKSALEIYADQRANLHCKVRFTKEGNGVLKKSALEMYEDQLSNLHCKVRFTKEIVCVPSYLEMWVFYEIWKVT